MAFYLVDICLHCDSYHLVGGRMLITNLGAAVHGLIIGKPLSCRGCQVLWTGAVLARIGKPPNCRGCQVLWTGAVLARIGKPLRPWLSASVDRCCVGKDREAPELPWLSASADRCCFGKGSPELWIKTRY